MRLSTNGARNVTLPVALHCAEAKVVKSPAIICAVGMNGEHVGRLLAQARALVGTEEEHPIGRDWTAERPAELVAAQTVADALTVASTRANGSVALNR